MSEEFEFVTNASQIEDVAPGDFRTEPHDLVGLKKAGSGKVPRVLVCAMSVGSHEDYIESTRVYRDGVYVGQNLKDDDAKLIYAATRGPDRTEIWPDVETAVAQIRKWPLPVKIALRNAINEVNSIQEPKVVEGNSEGDRNGSPSSDSPDTSGSGTSTE